MLRVGDPAPDLELVDRDQRPRTLSSFWRERPTVVLFLRHFG